ncbi:hypothetical protein Hanom_Chr13g01212671 [Helianthus anomalus]
MSLSTPQPSTPIPPSFLPLLDAIETQTLISHFHSLVKKRTIPHMTESKATPLEFHETLGVGQCYIYKSSLKATTVEATVVTSVLVESPQYQDKWAFSSTNLENSPIKELNTTTSGRDSDDLIKLGNQLRYKELTERMTSMESSMAEMKDMMKQMMEHFKSQPSTQQITNELWKSVQPIIQAQRNLADINHNTHMELVRNMVEARYKVTQAYIKAIREHLVKTTVSAPAIVLQKEVEDNAKRGRMIS